MPDPRYFRFDYDRNLVTEYERQGDCNGCGACCMAIIKWQAPNNRSRNWNPGNGQPDIVDKQGVYTALYWNDRWRFFYELRVTDEPERCKCLTADNRCSVHLGKRLISRAWPMLPEHVDPFPQCSYSFREIACWTMEAFCA